MKGLDESPERLRRTNPVGHPEEALPGQRGEGRGYVQSKDARIRYTPNNVIDDLSLQGEHVINHLFAFNTAGLM